MKTLKDHKLFQELVENPCWETLFDADFYPKNPNIPVLFGGLDHISKTKKYFTFNDIGCNGMDNSFRIGDANPIGETK
jgi:hypothetical protein